MLAGAARSGYLAAGLDFSRAAECVLTSTQVEGSYFIAGAYMKRDIREGKPGVDLALRLKVVDTAPCEPISGAVAEIWSCDALGNYSGHPDVDPNVPPSFLRGGPGGPGRGGLPPGGGRDGFSREPTGPLRFLRGAQTTENDGCVEILDYTIRVGAIRVLCMFTSSSAWGP